VVIYIAVRAELNATVDRTLVERASSVQAYVAGFGYELPPNPPLGGPGGYVQYINADGRVIVSPAHDVPLQVTARAKAVAAGEAKTFIEDAHVRTTRVRVLTVPLSKNIAVQVARPLDEVDRVLRRLRGTLLLVMIGGVAIAVGLGGGVSRTALLPVDELTEAAEEVARTRDPSRHIDAVGDDEIARLARSFNTMLEALDESSRAQRRLVADASHELRTPLTSLRTNIEVLSRSPDIGVDERARLVHDVLEQIDEIAALISDLMDLARGEEPAQAREPVSLDELVAHAVEQARTHYPSLSYVVEATPSTVEAIPARLERAVANLLDNAGKWSPPGATVRVCVAPGEVSVEDEGPGIAADDLPFIFDRFYRARGARALPGSGLGLAIVRQAAVAHGGTVDAHAREGGGTRMVLRIPTAGSA
jgi:two-component system, OmpR family, sensor histidine kinase MprB